MNETARQLWEQVLVLRCQAGDDDAFAELLEAYRERGGEWVKGQPLIIDIHGSRIADTLSRGLASAA